MASGARLIPITAPVAAAGGRRGLLDGVRAVHGLLGSKVHLDAARLEVVGLAAEALHERGGVLEVAGVAELDSRRALAGVVAGVGDIEPYIHIPALGFLINVGAEEAVVVAEAVVEGVVVTEIVEGVVATEVVEAVVVAVVVEGVVVTEVVEGVVVAVIVEGVVVAEVVAE